MAAKIWRNLPLLTSSVYRMWAENPLHLLLQTLRRLPHRLRDALGPGPAKPPLAAALWNFSADRHTEAVANLNRVEGDSKLANELRLNLRIPIIGGTIGQTARQSWERGDISGAFPPGLPPALDRRLQGEMRLLDPNQRISIPEAQRSDGSAPRSAEPRILHFLTNSLPWTNSGYSLRSHAILQAQQEAGFTVQAVTRLAYPVTIGRPQAQRQEEVDGVTYTRLLPRKLPMAPDQKLALQTSMLHQVTQEVSPSILHTTTNFANALCVNAVAESMDLPWVYEMRGELEKTWLARQPEKIRSTAAHSQRFALMRARETQMAKQADAVVALSQIQAQSLAERGIDEQKIVVIPNAVDSNLLGMERDPRSARERLGLQPDAFWVGTVSALVPYEGIDDLLRAVAFGDRNLHCLVVGDGVQRQALIGLAQELGIADRVIFPGKVAPKDAIDWYQALDVMVIPRKDTEVTRAVTPIKGLNAMALGIPQIVSDLPALSEVSTAEGQGISVPSESPRVLAEAISQLEVDPALLANLGENARKAAEDRTWKSAAAKYGEIYRRIL